MNKRQPDATAAESVVVWDLPTRVFHWLLVLSFTGAWTTAENDKFVYVHVYAGYVFFGLLMFRLLWGIVGSRYAQFRSFAHNWTSVTDYLRGLLSGKAQRFIGHNPAGGWAIFAMLVLGLLTALSGFIVFGGEEGHGPLKHLAGFDIGNEAKGFHEFFATSMLVMVFLHVGGVLVESVFHKENLIWAMLSGRKPAEQGTRGVGVYPLLGVAILFLVFGSGVYYFRGYVLETDTQPFTPFSSPTLADDPTWRKECSDCHLAFHPSLLPARSWRLMMGQQSDHFGDDLALDQDVVDSITKFLVDNAAETGVTEPSQKISRSIPANETPLRITETPYWKKKHDAEEIDPAYWKSKKVGSKANCAACHLDANTGWFEDSDMRLPKL